MSGPASPDKQKEASAGLSAESRREIKVGVFVIGLTLALGLTVFVLGGSSDLLKDRYTLHARWQDVAGLKEGAVVRLAGLDVGEVSKITFDSNLESKEVLVEMKLMSEFQPRIRRDSEARIDTVGVLGDKYVSLSMGDPKKDVLADGEWINARASLDVLEYMKKATDILNSTSSIAHKVDLMLGEDSEASKASLARSFSHLESLLQATKEGDGLLHALVYDPSMTTKVQATLGNLQVMSSDLRDATGAVRHGDGMAHELIYGEDGKRLAKDLADLSEALSALARDIRNEESVVHSLIYDKDKAQMVADLAAAAESLKRTSESIEKGDGTVGLMVRDPALYEDLRALVGGAQRNKLLRAYIRRTVEEGEQSNSSPWQPPEE